MIIAAFLPEHPCARIGLCPRRKILSRHFRLNLSNNQTQFHTVRRQHHQMHVLRHHDVHPETEPMFVTRFIKMAQEQADSRRTPEIRLHAKTAESHKPGGSKIIIMS